MQIQKGGFSLIEIVIGMMIVTIVMLAAFSAVTAIWIAKVKLIEKTEIEKQAYFATEKFFEMIKKWGTIDYEEYWNRYSYSTNYWSGHFNNPSWFGNFWSTWVVWSTSYGNSLYYCGSPNGSNMWTWWCLDSNTHQRYGEYRQQFIDRNSDQDADWWDEDGDGSIINDDDDLFLWEWPHAFSGTSVENKVWELYLVNSLWNERTLFRWNIAVDPDYFWTPTCSGTETISGSGCLWNIEFLKLSWRDYGDDHDSASIDANGSQFDGIIDTWLIHEDFISTLGEVVAGSNNQDYWQGIFPNTVHVSDAQFYVYPNKSLDYSWRDNTSSILVSPYVQIKMTLQPSYKIKRKITWWVPLVEIATTIQLSDLDIR